MQSIDETDLKTVEAAAGETNTLDKQQENAEAETRRRRRAVLRDANGNQVVNVRRVKRETGEEEEEADIQTERIIQVSHNKPLYIFSTKGTHSPQVVSPSDVQFKLAEDDKDEVVINLNSVPESLCLNTAAFIGVTVTFVMLLIVASIVIVFLWLRIRTLTRKNLL